ncbi:MAG: urease accessory protein UreE, partial [Gammaproteobacteria bacterium]|nr:urease accessory protein UreE [Gammaproteobacteria bacterium]
HILPDHVLEDMLLGLGMTIKKERHVFVPEDGAYSQGHTHSHSHSHSHSHTPSHSNSHSQEQA